MSKPERPALEIYIIWWITETCSFNLFVKVSLSLHNQFPASILYNWRVSAFILIKITWKIPLNKWSPLEQAMFLKTIPQYLSSLVNFKITQRLPANICWSWRNVLKTSSTRFQCNNFKYSIILTRLLEEVLKTRSRRLGRQKIVTLKTSLRRLEYMFWRRLETCCLEVFSKNPANIYLSRPFEDVFKICLEDVFNTSSTRLQRNNFSSFKTS